MFIHVVLFSADCVLYFWRKNVRKIRVYDSVVVSQFSLNLVEKYFFILLIFLYSLRIHYSCPIS